MITSWEKKTISFQHYDVPNVGNKKKKKTLKVNILKMNGKIEVLSRKKKKNHNREPNRNCITEKYMIWSTEVVVFRFTQWSASELEDE